MKEILRSIAVTEGRTPSPDSEDDGETDDEEPKVRAGRDSKPQPVEDSPGFVSCHVDLACTPLCGLAMQRTVLVGVAASYI